MSSRKVGKRFVNQERTVHAAPRDLIRWIKTRERGFWPRWVELRPHAPPRERVSGEALAVTFINHATVLLQFDGLNVITDPVFSRAVGPLGRVGPRRHHAPGISLGSLPPIDVVLISHDHYDHLDQPSVRRLERDHSPRFLVPLGNGDRLRRWGCARVDELDWWQTVEHAGHPFTFVPAQHFSGRALHDRDTTLWGGFVVGGAHGPLYFAGDTGMGPHFEEIRARFGPMRLALLPIGAYRPRWFMRRVHIDPVEAVEAHRILEAERSLGIHFGTFRLADEGRDDPVADLRSACAEQGVPGDAFLALEPGEGATFPPREAKRRLRGEGA
jgi:L-ascorbate metabolism protein UlaG (beta-lactamase superfamily)